MSRFLITVATISLLCHLASSQASIQEANQDTSNQVVDYLNKAIPVLCHIAANTEVKNAEVIQICEECPGGSYKGTSGSCEQCPAGKFSARGAARCTDCPAGKFSEAGQAGCKLCPAGTFSATSGSQRCSKCMSEFQYSNPGSSSCKGCPNWDLSNDGVGCLEKVKFKDCSGSSIHSSFHACTKATDGHRDGSAGYAFATKLDGERFFIGNLSNSVVVKKVILWRRTDAWRADQFNNIQVYTLSGTASTPTLCGSFTNTDKDYVVFDCNREANAIKVVRTDSSGNLSLVEAEVYV